MDESDVGRYEDGGLAVEVFEALCDEEAVDPRCLICGCSDEELTDTNEAGRDPAGVDGGRGNEPSSSWLDIFLRLPEVGV